ncbi:MAG TPA: LptF/LptG family permease [Armatimonadota bacterium]|jgi:lipopolysaccharide export system permease protein
MRTVDRYLLRELALPFAAGVFGFLLIFVGALLFTLLDLVVKSGTPFLLLAKLVALKVPYLMVHVLPYATLFAICLAVNRMARESEITAMRVAGVSLRRLMAPLALAALCVSLLSLFLSEKVSPATNHEAMRIYRLALLGPARPDLKQDVFFSAQGYTFYVRQVEKGSDGRFLLTDVMMYEGPAHGERFPVLTTARRATAEANATTWVLTEGVQIRLDASGFSSQEWAFKRMTLDLEKGIEQYWADQKMPDEMSSAELRKQIDLFGKGGIDVASLKVDYLSKLAFPFACLVLTLLSMPLTVHFSRGGPSMGFLVVVGLFFLYYNAYFLTKMLGSAGILPPLLAAWGPNVVFGALGLALLRREE